MKIIIDDLSSPQIIDFLRNHLRHMIEVTPPGCVHALDIEDLRRPEVTFWTGWENDLLICCGALKKINSGHAELKSMRTSPSHLGRGIASALLTHILTEAKKQKIERVFLETGSYEAFLPARKLYEKFNFEYCSPFADYVLNENSVYMTLKL